MNLDHPWHHQTDHHQREEISAPASGIDGMNKVKVPSRRAKERTDEMGEQQQALPKRGSPRTTRKTPSRKAQPCPYIPQGARKGASGGPDTSTLFPFVLHKLLEDAELQGFDSIVSWRPSGRSFKIHNKEAFVDQILQRIGKLSKYKSFVRQLNLWGVKCLDQGPEKGSYQHQFLVRGQPELCHNMRRVKIKSKAQQRKRSGQQEAEAIPVGQTSQQPSPYPPTEVIIPSNALLRGQTSSPYSQSPPPDGFGDVSYSRMPQPLALHDNMPYSASAPSTSIQMLTRSYLNPGESSFLPSFPIRRPDEGQQEHKTTDHSTPAPISLLVSAAATGTASIGMANNNKTDSSPVVNWLDKLEAAFNLGHPELPLIQAPLHHGTSTQQNEERAVLGDLFEPRPFLEEGNQHKEAALTEKDDNALSRPTATPIGQDDEGGSNSGD